MLRFFSLNSRSSAAEARDTGINVTAADDVQSIKGNPTAINDYEAKQWVDVFSDPHPNATPRLLKSPFGATLPDQRTPSRLASSTKDNEHPADERHVSPDHSASCFNILNPCSSHISASVIATEDSRPIDPGDQLNDHPGSLSNIDNLASALDVMTPMEPLPPGTPAGTLDALRRGILRDLGTPGSGRSVRFFSRDTYKFISPNASSDAYESAESKMIDASLYSADHPSKSDSSNTNSLSTHSFRPADDPSPIAQSFYLPTGPADVSNLLDLQPTQAMWMDETRAPALSFVAEEEEDEVAREITRAHSLEVSNGSKGDLSCEKTEKEQQVKESDSAFLPNQSEDLGSTTGSTNRQLSQINHSPKVIVQPSENRNLSSEEMSSLEGSTSLSRIIDRKVDANPISSPDISLCPLPQPVVNSVSDEEYRKQIVTLRTNAAHMIAAQEEHLAIVKRQRDRYRRLCEKSSSQNIQPLSPLGHLRTNSAINIHGNLPNSSISLESTGLPLRARLDDTELALKDALVRLEAAKNDAEEAKDEVRYWQTEAEMREMEPQSASLSLTDSSHRKRHSPAPDNKSLITNIPMDADEIRQLRDALRDHQLRQDELVRNLLERTEEVTQLRSALDLIEGGKKNQDDTELSELRQHIITLENDRKQAQVDLQNAQQVAAERDGQIVTLQNYLSETEASLVQQQQRASRLEDQIEQNQQNAKQTVQQIVFEFEKLQADHIALQDSHEKLKAGYKAMQDAKTQLQLNSDDFEDRATAAEKELEMVRKEAAELRHRSARKDLEISQLQRAKVQLREDTELLNIALDSKQQEVEMLKRRQSGAVKSAGEPSASKHHTSDVQAPPSTATKQAGFDMSENNFPETPIGRPVASRTSRTMSLGGSRRLGPLSSSVKVNRA